MTRIKESAATMPHQFFLSFARDLRRGKSNTSRCSRCVPWIESPLEKINGDPPHLYHHSDATPIELFFDLFFVANLSTFTATSEIREPEALWSYVGFLAIIWFTWLQVTLFDIRFARDSIFERICKAIQLATMVGFASAGSGFATEVRDDNVWIFRSFSILLATSRFLLCTEYSVAALYLHHAMPQASRRLALVSLMLLCIGSVYVGLYFAFDYHTRSHGSYIWVAWLFLFGIEAVHVVWFSGGTPEIGFENTHLNVRMSLLTLIIIGEGVISVTRIVNSTVGGGGWTRWSALHIVGVTAALYLLWQSYHDISPRDNLGRTRQQMWTFLHFPLHALLILLSEGSQILALTLDVSLKLRDLQDTMLAACEERRLGRIPAIDLLNSTIVDMEINYNGGALQEKAAIENILQGLRDNLPLCATGDSPGSLSIQNSHDLMVNVTVALFASMGIRPPIEDFESVRGNELLMMYLKLLGFVFVYYIAVASLTMFMFAAFVYIAQPNVSHVYRTVMIGIRVALGCVILSLISLITNFRMAYAFMTSPWILFMFTLALLIGLLGDRLWDWLECRHVEGTDSVQGGSISTIPMIQVTSVATGSPLEATSSSEH